MINHQQFMSKAIYYRPCLHPFVVWCAMVALTFMPLSCVDLEFDQPPSGVFDPNLPVNSSIAELKALHTTGQHEEITNEIIISGIVVSDDEAGNFFKQLVIQDETGGIEMRIEMSDLHSRYPVGRKVYVKAKGLWLGDYNGLPQLGAGWDQNESSLIRIPESLVDRFIIPATFDHVVTPEVLTVDQLATEDVNTLVRFENVQFVAADAGEPWANAALQIAVNREIEDCARRRLIVRTSGFAEFAGQPTPEGGGSLTGILTVFGSDFQVVVRDLEDVMMDGARCAVVIDESFSGIPDNEDIMLNDWANIAVLGSRLWRAREFDDNHYAQATAFGDQAPEMEAWLITPEIILNVPKKITFESAQAFYVHDGLSVWISPNFNGTNVTTASWIQLHPELAGNNDPEHAFIPSGDVDLSGFTGTVRVGFKYTGSGPGGMTTTFRIDNVKVSNL
jgi:hypothetical protein